MNQSEPLVQIIFFLAYLGVFNGLIIGIYFLVKSQRTVSDVYFGLLLLALTVRIGKSVFVYFDRSIDKLILQIGLSFCLFIGPFLLFYIRSFLRKETHFKKGYILQIIALAIIILSLGIVLPYRTEPKIWNNYIIYFIYGTWVVYVLLSLYELKGVIKRLLQSKLAKNESWLLIVYLGVLIITILYNLALFISFSYISGALTFSLLFYLLGLKVLLDRKKKITASKTESSQTIEIKRKLDGYMKESKPFKNPKLKLDDLAKALNIPSHMLSQALNAGDAGGFANYIKKLRIAEAKKLIQTEKHLSLDGIGLEAGFNSKSSFYPAFKKTTGLTPSQYRKGL